MKSILIALGWNVLLVIAALILGALFVNQVFQIFEKFFSIGLGGYPAALAVTIASMTLFTIFLLSIFGSRWWYWWVALCVLLPVGLVYRGR